LFLYNNIDDIQKWKDDFESRMMNNYYSLRKAVVELEKKVGDGKVQ